MAAPAGATHHGCAMRVRHFVTLTTLAALLIPAGANASTMIDRNAQRRHVEGRRQRPGAGLVHGARQALERARVERRQRTAPHSRQETGRLQARLLGRLGHVQEGRLEDLREHLRRVHRPALAWRVTSCTAKDGSHWALQAWQRMLPNYGLTPSPKQAVWELRLSHWTGDLPALTVNTNWAYRKFDHLFGNVPLRRRPRARLQVDGRRQPARLLRPQPVRRHVQLGLRRSAGSARTAS